MVVCGEDDVLRVLVAFRGDRSLLESGSRNRSRGRVVGKGGEGIHYCYECFVNSGDWLNPG